MSFHKSLQRLREAATSERSRGLPQGRVIVDQRDLNELLYHFDRLDREARARYAQEQEAHERAIHEERVRNGTAARGHMP